MLQPDCKGRCCRLIHPTQAEEMEQPLLSFPRCIARCLSDSRPSTWHWQLILANWPASAAGASRLSDAAVVAVALLPRHACWVLLLSFHAKRFRFLSLEWSSQTSPGLVCRSTSSPGGASASSSSSSSTSSSATATSGGAQCACCTCGVLDGVSLPCTPQCVHRRAGVGSVIH